MFGPSNISQDICRRLDVAASERGTLESHWQEIALRILPDYSNSFTNGGMLFDRGAKRTAEMVDATGTMALIKFAAAMESMLTPRSQTWHRIAPLDTSLLRNSAAKVYYDDLNAALFHYRYEPKANYASQQHEVYMGLGAFGTGAKYTDALRLPGGGLRYRAIHMSEIYFFENHQGIIDTAFRKFPRTALQAVQDFGFDNVSKKIQEAAQDPKKCDTNFWFVHAVMPRADLDPRRLDVKGMPYASYTLDYAEKTIVRESGYRVFPYDISRYVVAPGELYGRSPAMLALPSLKLLNEQKKVLLKQGHRTVDPVILAGDDGVIDAFSLKPGSINYGRMTEEGKRKVDILPTGRVDIGRELMDDERHVINDLFLVSLFQILVETPQMTATEVLERAREKGALLSPTMGRQQSEGLGPQIEREIDVLAAQGLLPEMPMIVKEAARANGGLGYRVIYDSPLSKAQRAEEAAGYQRWLDSVREYSSLTGDLSPLDWAEWDESMPDMASIYAVPSRWVSTPEKVAAKRQNRAQAQQQQQAVEAAPAAAGLMKAAQQ